VNISAKSIDGNARDGFFLLTSKKGAVWMSLLHVCFVNK
jgi:hypothetical protein